MYLRRPSRHVLRSFVHPKKELINRITPKRTTSPTTTDHAVPNRGLSYEAQPSLCVSGKEIANTLALLFLGARSPLRSRL